MIRLLRAEARRLAARRLVRRTVLLVAVAIAVGGILMFATTSSMSEATYRQRAHAVDVQRRERNDTAVACLHAHGVTQRDQITDKIARECLPNGDVTAHDPRFHRQRLKGILQGVAGVLAIIGWALGASMVGAEFASRSMTTLLTWETRRTRVLLAKMAVVILAIAAFAALALIAVALAMLPALILHGAPLRAGDPSWSTLAGIIVRGTGLAALSAGIGFAIATIGRNTAAALGVGFAYIIVLENILGSSLREWRRWLLLGNAIVFVSGKAGVDIPGRSVTGAGLFLGAVAVALLAAATFAFRARDIA